MPPKPTVPIADPRSIRTDNTDNLHFYLAGNQGVFFLATNLGGIFYVTVNLRDLLPNRKSDMSMKEVSLYLEDGEIGTREVVRKRAVSGSPFVSFEVQESHHFTAFGLRWRFAPVFRYKPGLEDWILIILATIFAFLGASAIYFQRQFRDDKNYRLEQSLRAQRMSMFGTVAGGIVHDFNNVLVGIVGTLSIVRDMMTESAEVPSSALERPVGVMERAAERGSKILARLVSLAKPDRDPKHPLVLTEVLEEVVELVQGTAGRDVSISLVVHEAARNVFVLGNSTQLEQAFMNLAVNGIHAMTLMRNESDKTGGVLRIDVEHYSPDKRFARRHLHDGGGKAYVKVIIRDTGVGMDEKTVERLFTPFFTTKNKNQGTGLGLSSVYLIVKSHKGYIEVQSTPGKGSVFSVFLPTADAGETS